MPIKYCAHGGCSVLVPFNQRYCNKHTKDRYVPRERQIVTQPYYKLYHSSRWGETSRAYRAANPLCEECLRHGKQSLATSVDHIKALKDGGDPWDDSNLQSLCARCHNRKTVQENKEREKNS